MMSKQIQINRKAVISLLLTTLLLSLITPVLTTAAPNEFNGLETDHAEKLAPCVSTEGIILGREGGLLSLLGIDGHSESVAAIVKGNIYSPQAIYDQPLPNHVVYRRTDC